MNEITAFFKQHQVALEQNLIVAGLLTSRLVGIFYLFPAIGGRLVPTRIKIGTALVFMILLHPIVIATKPSLPKYPSFELLLLLVKEFIVGFSIGFISTLIFYGIESAGRFLDLQRGATMANMFDPYLEIQASPLGEFKLQIAIVIFLILNFHHIYLTNIANSFLSIPIDGLLRVPAGLSDFCEFFIRQSADIFVIAIKLVIPCVIVIFLIDVCLGIINRVAPQIQVFFLGMPLRAILGIFILFLALTLVISQIEGYSKQTILNLKESLKYLIQIIYHGR
jgi:flagellar biosynthetic protein FliR